MFDFFKRKNKEKVDYAGYFDSRTFDYFNASLEYAKDRIILEDESCIIRGRVYLGWLFKFVLVKDFIKFNYNKTTNTHLIKKDLLTEEEKNTTKSINIYVIEYKDRQTKEFALENTFMTNNGYQQVLIYNNEMVCLEYYKPLPEYDFQLMKYYRTAIFFDLACHDKEDY